MKLLLLHEHANSQLLDVYHGTTSKYSASIEMNGLIPSAEQGADAAALRGGENYRTTYGVLDSVFVTNSATEASRFAGKVANAFGGEPVVYKIRAAADKLSDDPAGGSSTALRHRGPIGPQQLVDKLVVDWDHDALTSMW